MSHEHLTAADIRAALRLRYNPPGANMQACVIAFEVAAGTGQHARRHLDAVVMHLWPSRGLLIEGIEIKVSRSDFKRELLDPAKAEEIARYCDFFHIAAPKGMIAPAEMPHGWGLIEVADGKTREAKPAERHDAAPVDRNFLAAMLRAGTRGDNDLVGVEIQKEKTRLYSEMESRIEKRAKELAARQNEQAANWSKLMEAIGENPDGYIFPDDVIKSVALVRRAGVTNSYNGVKGLIEIVDKLHERLAEIAGDMQMEITPHEPLHLKAARRKKA